MERLDGTNPLGEFLRARRELVRPEDAGIRTGGLRRVPGLRREEVATLAGISSDYYLRLVELVGKLVNSGTDGLVLVVFHAEPGEPPGPVRAPAVPDHPSVCPL